MDTQFASYLVGRITEPLNAIRQAVVQSHETQKEILRELKKLNEQQG